MNFFAISGLINGIAATIFGLFGYLKNRKALIHKIFGLMNGAVAIWSYGYFLWLISGEEQTALFWTRVLALGATLIPILFLHWIFLLLGIEKEKKFVLIAGYVATFILAVFSFSPLYVAKVEPALFFKFWPKPGILYHFYIIFIYLGLLGYGCYQLLLSYKKTSGILRQQIKFVLFGDRKSVV